MHVAVHLEIFVHVASVLLSRLIIVVVVVVSVLLSRLIVIVSIMWSWSELGLWC